MTDDTKGITPYRSMDALEIKPKKIHGIIPSKYLPPTKHTCSLPTLNRFARWLFFWLPALKYGSVYRCQKCGTVWEADWEYPHGQKRGGWEYQELKWEKAHISKWVQAGGDEK